MIRTLIIHRTHVVSAAMANILSNEADVQVVGCVAKTDEALELLAEYACDVIVLNVTPLAADAVVFVRTVTSLYPSIKLIVMGVNDIPELILQYFQAGATGYADQSDTIAELLKKLRSAHAGEAIIAPRVAAALISRVAELNRLVTTAHPSPQDQLSLRLQYKELTRREHQILGLIEEGLSNQEIAERLTIELGTVKNHVHSILRKLNVENRRHAVMLKRMVLESDYRSPTEEMRRIGPVVPSFRSSSLAQN
jgi:two-component system, NarL family, nitrate/nitrite response regulator NarL